MRIVSLVPSLTELVCALGLADRLVGRTGFCVHPRDLVRHVPKVGGTKTVRLDAVRALAPTHVILNVDENRKETADALAEFVPHLVVTHPLGPLDNLALYRQFGEAFDRPREAEALCARFEAAYDAARADPPAPRDVLYLIWKDPWMTVSRDTYISRTLAVFGMRTVPAQSSERYPKLADLRA
ncbi:MAG TPA: helical backbone metal receptor, partial [Burkholderiales bacterium]|nr:helical backbone metal receptor [Burkholderiales bacterium]